VSAALALDPNDASAHLRRAAILIVKGRLDESIAESERALALDPAIVLAYGFLGQDYRLLGQFEKSLEYFDKAIRLSPRDPSLVFWYQLKAGDHFALKQYEQAIESARRAIAINPNGTPWPHFQLITALARGGHEAEAHEALQSYLASVPTGPKTIAAWKAAEAVSTPQSDPRVLEALDRHYDGLRKAGMPEE
jgi:adenylate cyclase